MLARTGQRFLRRLVVKPHNHHAFSSSSDDKNTPEDKTETPKEEKPKDGSIREQQGPWRTKDQDWPPRTTQTPPPPPTKLEEVIKLYKPQLSELKGRGEGLSKRRVKMEEAIEKASGEKKLTMMDQLLELEIEIEDNDKDVEKVGSILESLTAGTSS